MSDRHAPTYYRPSDYRIPRTLEEAFGPYQRHSQWVDDEATRESVRDVAAFFLTVAACVVCVALVALAGA